MSEKRPVGETIALRRTDAGLSMIELMVSMVVLLVITSAGFSAFNRIQKFYVSNSSLATLYSTVRSAVELMGQEIGQAGAVCGRYKSAGTGVPIACSGTTLSSAVVVGGTTATLASTTGLYVGEKLTFDSNSASKEVLQIGSISGTTITLATGKSFTKAHAASSPVTVAGVAWRGILVPESTSTSLKMFGDMDGDGTLSYVEYTCDFTGRRLTRSSTPITAATKNTADTLIDNLIFVAPSGYTGADYCFTYLKPTTVGPDSNGTSYSVATQVGLLISIESAGLDPQTKQHWRLTKSFLNLAPRNVVAAYDFAANSVYEALQPLPGNLPLP